MLARASASQAQYNPVKKLPEVDQQHHQPQQGQQQQQPLLQTLPTPQKYRVSPMDLMRPVKTKAETVLLYTEWANHYLQKAGYECFITDLQNDLRDGKMLVNLTHAVVNEHVILKDSNKSSRDIIVACLKVLEDIGVEVHDVSVDGILSGRLKCILGLFFNLSKFKQKLRERQSQPNQIVHSEIPQKSGDSPLNSTGLDSPGSDRRYVTPPSSVQSHVQHHSRPLSDPQALKKPIDAKSRLPVFRQNRTKNCLSDSPQPKSGEVAASSLPTRSIRLPQPIKNQKNLPSKAPTSSLGSPGTNPPMLPMSRPGGVLVKHPSSLPQPASIQMRSLVDIGGSRPLREISAENSPQQPISKSTGTNNAITPPLFTKSHMQHYPPSNYPGVSQLPTPTLSFNAGILRFKRPSDFLPQSLTPTPSSKSSSTASLSLTSNGGHNLSNSSKTRHDEHVNVNGVKDDEEGEGEGSPLGSREINRAVSQLEDVNPGTWSGRLSPTLPGMSTSNGHFYLTTARQRASLDTHLHNKQTSTSANHNDGDDKSIKSECLPGKDLNRPMKSLGIPPTLFSSESNLFTPDAWSNSLPNRPFHRAMKATTRKSPSTLVQLRARADGREEVPTERIYGPLGFLKLPYDPPRSHTDLGEVKSPYSVLGCTDMKHSAEICHLRRELETARLKVTTLTSQLELNVKLVCKYVIYPALSFYPDTSKCDLELRCSAIG
ncbi:neuron navigator 3 [Echinococcus multilocularis]|uniref:Neuron navigator 3 n=1 Tax=Echinococcus multilocularis TaxID=6211 RepID=A0A068YHJ3_ECHMU|nr:neuron navigator 3 [Echinococcus multilocularis]